MSNLPICKPVFAGNPTVHSKNRIKSMNTCSFQQRIGAVVKYFKAKAHFKSDWYLFKLINLYYSKWILKLKVFILLY